MCIRDRYLTGTSNGALMTYSYAFQFPETIKAIAVSSGNLPEFPESGLCTNGSNLPLPILITHGTSDPAMPCLLYTSCREPGRPRQDGGDRIEDIAGGGQLHAEDRRAAPERYRTTALPQLQPHRVVALYLRPVRQRAVAQRRQLGVLRRTRPEIGTAEIKTIKAADGTTDLYLSLIHI